MERTACGYLVIHLKFQPHPVSDLRRVWHHGTLITHQLHLHGLVLQMSQPEISLDVGDFVLAPIRQNHTYTVQQAMIQLRVRDARGV